MTSHTVGIALHADKAKKHVNPSLVQAAAEAGIGIKVIDGEKTLEEQEPFEVLLHKLRSPEWRRKLEDYQQKHPHLKVVDPFDSVMRLANRVTMLEPFKEGLLLQAPSQRQAPTQANFLRSGSSVWERRNSLNERRSETVIVGTPRQVVIEEGTQSAQARQLVEDAGFKPPYVGKPLWADGRAGSHGLLVINDESGLEQVVNGPRPKEPTLPIVLQQFCPHGTCLFKVYVMGPITVLVKRPSLRLPVASTDVEEEVGSVQSVGRISAFYSTSEFSSHPEEEPPHWAIEGLALELRKRLKLDLFNFDLIRPGTSQHDSPGSAGQNQPDFLLIDINAFPGFEKLPEYEELFVAYLKSLFASPDKPEQRLVKFVAYSHVTSVTPEGG